MSNLGRINLLVGKNGIGKTSVLEALHLLATSGHPSALWAILGHRGEQAQQASNVQPEFMVSHLFYGHQLRNGSHFAINAANTGPSKSITFDVRTQKPQDNPALFAILKPEGGEPPSVLLGLEINSSQYPAQLIPLSRRGGVRQDVYQLVVNIAQAQNLTDYTRQPQFVSANSISMFDLISMWSSIVLTPEEDRVTYALRSLEPKIERIAALSQLPPIYSPFVSMRGGFQVKLSNQRTGVPIGSLGDGIWRFFALAMSLSRAQDSILVVDEIDSGLHYTSMRQLWKMVFATTKELNLQLFATTHSYDCVTSLAEFCKNPEVAEGDVSIQRIEGGETRSVAFSKSDIEIAAKRNIEMR